VDTEMRLILLHSIIELGQVFAEASCFPFPSVINNVYHMKRRHS